MTLDHPDLLFIVASYIIALLVYGFVTLRTFLQSKQLKRLLKDLKTLDRPPHP